MFTFSLNGMMKNNLQILLFLLLFRHKAMQMH